MNPHFTDVIMRVVGSVVIATAGASTISDVLLPYVGVPLNVLVACVAGAYSSFSFGERVEPRSRMFQLFTACVIMGWAFTVVVNAAIFHWLDGFKLTDGAAAGMGAIVSCLTRFFIPALIERIGPWMDKLPFLRKKESE